MRAPRESFSRDEEEFMRRALHLARKGFGGTSPNPMVGAVIVRDGVLIGEGFHKRAGEAHAEVNAIAAGRRAAKDVRGATLYVTLEPCSTFGRTPPCTSAIIESGISEVIVGATDPNAKHAGKGFELLRKAGIRVRQGLLADECMRLNEAFNHWISHRRPFVVCKCAMSLDGKIATNSGESKWITGAQARAFGMRLRLGADAIVAGVNTILRDDPALTLRPGLGVKIPAWKKLRRIVLDPNGRIPESARVLTDENAALTTVVVTGKAQSKKIKALERLARVIVAPVTGDEINLRWLMRLLGDEEVTSLLVEGGGETHYSFLRQSLVGRIHFFHAPVVITGRDAAKGVGGERTLTRGRGLALRDVEWTKVGEDLLCSALVAGRR
jgi:diaminohydroxyphosphoribosylaminopyrimidine deaminase / 5-amino-6-(5-phosphoribosylamino)uracil reductase